VAAGDLVEMALTTLVSRCRSGEKIRVLTANGTG
jgi:hypothetical protein